MNPSRQIYSATATQNTTTSTSDYVDLDLHELYTPVVLPQASDVKSTLLLPTDSAMLDVLPQENENEAFKNAYFDKTFGLKITNNLAALKNVVENDDDAVSDWMLMEGKTKYNVQEFAAMIRPSRSTLRLQMQEAIMKYRQYSYDYVSYFDYKSELKLFWDALERKMMHQMQSDVKKKNVTISIGHLRPETMRLFEYEAPTPVSCKFCDKSTKLNGSPFKYKVYSIDFKFDDCKKNGYGIPCDTNKNNKWFLIKYRTKSKRWYFVKASKVKFMYNFLLQEVKVCISFDTWLHMPAGIVEGIDEGHWTCI